MREPTRQGYLQEIDGIVIFMADPHGALRIYEEPKAGMESNVIGADVAEGLEKGDDSAVVVLGIESNNTLAVYNSNKTDPDQFALFLNMLGKYYRHSFIGVERNSIGFSVVSDLVKSYPNDNLYFNYRLDEKKQIKTKKFGWITDERTRHLILSYLKQEVREASTDLRDKILIQQCMKFVMNDGKPQAAEGEKDDLVMARAIAGMMRRHRLSQPVAQKVFQPEMSGRAY
jgi:hypothetical protein